MVRTRPCSTASRSRRQRARLRRRSGSRPGPCTGTSWLRRSRSGRPARPAGRRPAAAPVWASASAWALASATDRAWRSGVGPGRPPGPGRRAPAAATRRATGPPSADGDHDAALRHAAVVALRALADLAPRVRAGDQPVRRRGERRRDAQPDPDHGVAAPLQLADAGGPGLDVARVHAPVARQDERGRSRPSRPCGRGWRPRRGRPPRRPGTPSRAAGPRPRP